MQKNTENDPHRILIDLLAYPRTLARASRTLEYCVHNGDYDRHDPRCLLCGSGLECGWLFHADEYSGLERKPLPEIAEALRFAIDFVDAHLAFIDHRIDGCRCATCTWLCRAREIMDGGDFHG